MTQVALVQPDVAVPPALGEDSLYEVTDGRRVEMPPMSAYDVRIAAILLSGLEAFAREQRLGRAVGEMLFLLGGGRQRRPDVAFVSYQSWPRERGIPRTSAWEVVPDLAVEVVSPTNYAEEILTRVLEFFQAGTRQVWVVYPGLRQVYAYQSPTQIQVLTGTDQIDGAPLLPGFPLPVAALFEEEGASA